MKPQFENASNTFKTLNPHLYGLGKLPDPIAEHDSPKALVSRHARKPKVKARVAPLNFRVTLVAYVLRRRDDDGIVGGLKWLRDAIAKSIGIDDGDPRIEWEYGQVLTRGSEGVMVKLEIEQSTTAQASIS